MYLCMNLAEDDKVNVCCPLFHRPLGDHMSFLMVVYFQVHSQQNFVREQYDVRTYQTAEFLQSPRNRLLLILLHTLTIFPKDFTCVLFDVRSFIHNSIAKCRPMSGLKIPKFMYGDRTSCSERSEINSFAGLFQQNKCWSMDFIELGYLNLCFILRMAISWERLWQSWCEKLGCNADCRL